ncbi:biopolymer transporter ExbD [Solimonas fluminis]|jgi:biopolymer transport protein ExbD|uniref:Biopolymer transporter ExbD n=1 Tax=Solimonas fluminis TaxID=2086571 RepID=A0A2S5T9W9_9GAMM|nr:biopolymer transporter ExbD [Solimonas fluminis]PPE71795.1 biopolymer transporter ExbD [Solimonas fluminis]PPE71801.1 biopolymer transporter ExbD [Solimonas fluminis]
MGLRHRRQHVEHEEEAIDLAPMLDFVLNLLIFFIITAVFVKEVGLTLNTPPPAPPNQKQEEEDNSTLFIAVHKNGDISIDQRLVDPAAIRANVERFRGEKPDGPVIVVANTKAPTGMVVKAMDQARAGGAMNVMLQPTTTK